MVDLFLGVIEKTEVQENMTAAALSDAGEKSRWCRFNCPSEERISPGKQDTLSAGWLRPDW